MGWLDVLYWVLVFFGWCATGFVSLLGIDSRFPDEMDQVVGSTAPGEVICFLIWPWILAGVLILAWRHRDDLYQDEHTFF
jgi:hypothetical protein